MNENAATAACGEGETRWLSDAESSPNRAQFDGQVAPLAWKTSSSTSESMPPVKVQALGEPSPW
jgi:hypothetical protein